VESYRRGCYLRAAVVLASAQIACRLVRAYMLGQMFFEELRDSVRRHLWRRIEMLNEKNLVALLVVKQFVDKIFGH
jgi:hypothetical protein